MPARPKLAQSWENPQAFIFLMDYARSRRIKLWGKARVVEDDPALLHRLRDPAYPGKVERAILFEIEAWDVNCPQHIHKRFSLSVGAENQPAMGASKPATLSEGNSTYQFHHGDAVERNWKCRMNSRWQLCSRFNSY